MGMLSRRQLSATEKMAAIFGPASLLPRCGQFFRLRWGYGCLGAGLDAEDVAGPHLARLEPRAARPQFH